MNIKLVNILEVADIVSGSTPKGIDDLNTIEGNVPFFRVGDMNTKGNEIFMYEAVINLTSSSAAKLKLKLCRAGTVVFPKRGGAIFTNKKRKLSQVSAFDLNTMGLVPNEKVENEYFYYWFNSLDLGHLANGSSVPQLNNKQISPLSIPLPPLDQQKKIAAILDAADAYRKKTKALIVKYDELTQSLFLDMFGDPVGNPKGWKVNNLKNISNKIHSGNTPKGGSKVYVDEGITFFRSQNVWKNRIVYDDVVFIDQATHDKMLKSSLKHRDILMTKTGRINTENSSLGRAAMYLGEDDQANVNGHVYLIRLNEGVLNEFVLHILTTKQYRGHIRRVCVGGIDKRQLNKGHIEDFPIISPPIDMQENFISRLLLMKQHKDKLKASLAQAEDLFNSLLQKAFKGELV
jgi:type I restriction enzyme S subunit